MKYNQANQTAPAATQEEKPYDQELATDMLKYLSGRTPRGQRRIDAADTQFLARQLEHIRTQTFDILFPDLRYKDFIPPNNDVDPGAESVTYRQWEPFGIAAIVNDYTTDTPAVDVLVREFTGTVKTLASHYSWSKQDLRRAALARSPLLDKKSQAAKRSIETRKDLIAAFGDADANLPGFLNFVDVPLIVLQTGTWTGATPELILADLHFGPTSIRTLTNTVHTPNTLILDIASFELISTTPANTANASNVTIAKHFVENSPYITDLDSWYQLDLGDAGRTGPRIVFYDRNPVNVTYVNVVDFEQNPPQPLNLAFQVIVEARTGGVEWHYPLSAAYADNHA